MHAAPNEHLRPSNIGDIVLSDDMFFADMQAAAEKYFDEVTTRPDLQTQMLARLADVNRGGSIVF
jgi:hypothetical protein